MDNHHFYIQSEDREDYNNTSPANFRVALSRELNPHCIEVSFCQLPNTFYNITASNNNFLFNNVPQTITPGCYTLSEALTEFASVTGLTVGYNDITNLITISAGANFSLNFNVQNSIGKLLGFKTILYSAQNSYTGTFGPKIYHSAVYISLNIGNGVLTSSGLKNVSFVIPNNVNKSELIQFYARTQFSLAPNVKKNGIQHFEVRVFDEKGNELQGLSDWSLLIKLFY